MPWSADGDAGGFSTGEPWLPVVEEHLKLAVDRQEADPESNLRFVRDFLAWRREQPVLKWGGERVHGGDCAPLIVWDRYGDGRVLTCVANFSLKDALFPCGENASERLVEVPGSTARATDHGVVLGPLAFAMLRSKDRAAALDTRGSA